MSTFCITDVVSEASINLGRICLSEWFSFCYFTVDSILYMRKIWAVPVRLLINLLNYLLSYPQSPNKKLYLILKVTFNFSPSLIINNLKYFHSLLHFIWISCFRFIFLIWFTLPLVYLLFQLKCLTPGPVRFPPVNHFYYFSALWAGGLVIVSHYQDEAIEVVISESWKVLLWGSSDCDTKENNLHFFFPDKGKNSEKNPGSLLRH